MGQGTLGPQYFGNRNNNQALYDTVNNDKVIHLFNAVGKDPAGTSAKLHEYVGAFHLDPEDPYTRVTAPDAKGQDRTVILFHLMPDDHKQFKRPSHPIRNTVPKNSSSSTVPREHSETVNFRRQAILESDVVKRERIFEDSLIEHFEQQGFAPKRKKISVVGQRQPLFTDTWIEELNELFEAKGDATRNDIRMAVAQLQDYRRHITPAPQRCTVVVPFIPSEDLIDLVQSVGLSLAVFDEDGLLYVVKN